MEGLQTAHERRALDEPARESCCGQVQAQGPRGHAVVVTAHVPLERMFGHIGQLRALSSGRAQFTMQLGHYAEAPARAAMAA